MSTFPTVHPLSFALATAIASPKLLIHVFIGSRLAQIAENGGKMDASTKAINYASIIIGSIIGAAVGWFIYRKTMARAKQLEEEELENGLQDGGLIVGGRDRSYMDLDETEEDAAALMVDPDDISLWDQEEGGDYRDEFTDEEDVFASGDVENDAAGKAKR
jgi:golgi apparatus membrane protein TVP38